GPEPQDYATDRYDDLEAVFHALDRGEDAPDLVVVPLGSLAAATTDIVEDAHRTAADALVLLQTWIADERLAAARLVILTQRAVSVAPDEDVLDLAHAPLWGLVHSALNE